MIEIGDESLGNLKNSKYSQKLLHFGSLIYLSFVNEDNKEFFATAEGFNKTKLRLKTRDSMNLEGTFMRGLFRIYPSFFDNEFLKTKKKYENQKNLVNLTNFDKRGNLFKIKINILLILAVCFMFYKN